MLLRKLPKPSAADATEFLNFAVIEFAYNADKRPANLTDKVQRRA
jgi:hypothetical protein